ncbi:MAG: AraC family transcriptional regulator [Bacteroidales bacterium]|jgi:AraC-like DNA-binding protein|nr:AraC family transcriptional regulator [Bacteroidales bacterium]MCI2144629.1 AraC family transcriptional regulator [Bacteroidales bacterium]
MSNIQCEVTPLLKDDLFVLLNNAQAKFDYPVHFHSDYELNLVLNTSGKRIVGDSVEDFEKKDLVLLGPGIPHKWKAPTHGDTRVITIQFQDKIYDSFLMNKRVCQPIRELLARSSRGVAFSGNTLNVMTEKLFALSDALGFNTMLDFYGILYYLSMSEDQRLLTSASYDSTLLVRESKSRRIEKICRYIEQNYMQEITLSDISGLVNMSESAASHFFKKRTGRSFITYLTDFRIGAVSRMLIETTRSIADIAYNCGFANLSNFNRIFKKYKNQTPAEYRAGVYKTMNKY